MKNILIFLLVSILFSTTAFGAVEDTSIVDELSNKDVKELNFDFKLKKFKSCEDLESVMDKYIKDYWKANKGKYNYPVMYRAIEEPVIMEDSAVDGVALDSVAKSSDNESLGGNGDFSKTNTQVVGVDESDIIKTDGDYVYYYNSAKKYVYIIEAKDKNDLKIVKKIKVPSFFSSPVLYIDKNRLVILSSGYSSKVSYKNYWIDRKQKTYTVVYDIEDKENISLLKIYMTDGYLTKSRKIGDYLYIISNNSFNIPYYNFKNIDDISFSLRDIMPTKVDISKTSDSSKQNLKIRGKTIPYHITAGNVASCDEIEYILPDEETLKKYSFNPSYNIISTINIADTSKDATTKVVAGSNNEIYMSTNNLYLTSSMYSPYDYRCPVNARCIMPFYYGGMTNTLIHKLSVDKMNLDYKTSSIVPGRPLTQYSMDEKDKFFRIITTTNNWGRSNERHTDLYILDENLGLVSSLNNLGNGENFQSSRFMGDKLFLVTFKQIDPLYAIELKDQKNPKILGELKIPGYSTYLHPYDDNHLIGLGYDTYENKWGGTRNGGIKIDLYEINYDKKCGDTNLTNEEKAGCDDGSYKGIIVKQSYSYTIGDAGSYSEAQRNPRMFMWNSDKKLLLLPATIYVNESKDSYRHIDFFQGLLALSIDKNSGIKQKYKISHIDTNGLEEKRQKECKIYLDKNKKQQECRKLIDGSEYCPPKINSYVPEYCYADTPIGAYLASRSWNFKDSFIKRALWIEDTSFAISDDKISSHNLDTGVRYDEEGMK